MSQQNVERVHRGVEAFNRRDLDAFMAFVDPEAHFTPQVVALEGGYHGHDGIRRWWGDLLEIFPDWSLEADEVRDLGHLTLASLRVRGHGGDSGIPVDQVLWQVAEWSENGKAIRFTHHGSEAQALEAVGLRE